MKQKSFDFSPNVDECRTFIPGLDFYKGKKEAIPYWATLSMLLSLDGNCYFTKLDQYFTKGLLGSLYQEYLCLKKVITYLAIFTMLLVLRTLFYNFTKLDQYFDKMLQKVDRLCDQSFRWDVF